MRERASPPPIIERVRAEHVGLDECLGALARELTHDESGELRERAIRRTLHGLEALARRLSEHFALEEKGGYLSDVRAAAPRLSRQIELLARDHGELLSRVELLVERAREAPGSDRAWTDTRMELAGFLRALRAHESAENDLVFEAFVQDVSASD